MINIHFYTSNKWGTYFNEIPRKILVEVNKTIPILVNMNDQGSKRKNLKTYEQEMQKYSAFLTLNDMNQFELIMNEQQINFFNHWGKLTQKIRNYFVYKF